MFRKLLIRRSCKSIPDKLLNLVNYFFSTNVFKTARVVRLSLSADVLAAFSSVVRASSDDQTDRPSGEGSPRFQKAGRHEYRRARLHPAGWEVHPGTTPNRRALAAATNPCPADLFHRGRRCGRPRWTSGNPGPAPRFPPAPGCAPHTRAPARDGPAPGRRRRSGSAIDVPFVGRWHCNIARSVRGPRRKSTLRESSAAGTAMR